MPKKTTAKKPEKGGRIHSAPRLKCSPVVLAVLDGWGIAPKGPGNAIAAAKTPFLDRAKRKYKYTELEAHGRYVGLLPDQEGNSEAGHMNIGAGRVVRQDIVTVSESIRDGTFFKNTAFKEVVKHARKYKTTVHVMGLLSSGGSAHAASEHLYALLQLLHDEGANVRIHLFTDGRDSPPDVSLDLLKELEHHVFPEQVIASVMGRFYAMDRNKIWSRTELAYNAIMSGEGIVAKSHRDAIRDAYERGETDEFITPTVIVDKKNRPVGRVKDNDVFVFFNLRSDRARQLTKSFVQKDFEKRNDGAFKRKHVPKNTRFAAMTEFGPDLEHVYTAYPSSVIRDGLTETLAPYRQFYVAESEKYAHVTYFMNGGFSKPMFGEQRMRVPSQFVAHHDTLPEMRAGTITDEVVRRIRSDAHDFYAINYANADMVGHTGNVRAAIAAVEYVDKCLKRLAESVLEAGGCLMLVGDHGNAEYMRHLKTQKVATEHTANPVPLYVIGENDKKAHLGDGMLSDVAPTILDIMGIPKPASMTGFSLLRR